MRRSVLVVVALVAFAGGSVALASVTAIESSADVARPAHRLAPPYRPDVSSNELVALDMVEVVNEERNRRGLPIFQAHSLVAAAAMTHSEDMAARRRMVHFGADGADTGDRLDREGFAWRTWGEAIGAGYDTTERMFDAWMASDAHRPHLLSSNTFIGVGVAATPDGVPYWTLVVAS